MPRRPMLVIVAGVILTIAGTQPAQAARWDGTDAAGDAADAVDISHLTVWNGAQRLVTRIRFYDLRKNRVGGAGAIIDTGAQSGEAYAVSIRWNANQQRFVRRFYRLPALGDAVSTRLRCRGVEVDWKTGPEHTREWVTISDSPDGSVGL